ncbi:hypothetical protein [Myxococcus phage Mx4 ts27htf-1hrm-1]|nr:hypothetical protein Mx4_p12 [Myxococcus phage Mx4]WNM70354.1 hypothetical protein [Myxococcus phage Mx4 ts27htf-1hrm-1]
MTVLHLNVLPPPAYPEERTVTAGARITVRTSGPGYRATALDASGKLVVSLWAVCRTTASEEVERLVTKLASIAAKHPDGVPFERRRAA